MNITRKRFLLAAGAACLLSACETTNPLLKSQEPTFRPPIEPQRVYFAGVSLTGNYKDNQKNTPFSVGMLDDLDSEMREVLKGKSFKYIDLVTSEPGDIRDADSLAVTLGVDLETVVVYPWPENKFKVVVDIYTQLLFFDFAEKKVVRSVPINYQYITLLKHKPSRKELKDIIYGMYVGKLDGVEKGVLQTVVEKLQNIIVQSSYKAYLKVENVEIGDRAQKMVDRFDMTSDQFKTLMAQMFVRSLVDNLAVAVIPYTVGQAIGGKMVGRFRNGVEYSLTMPEPDYVFDLSLRSCKTLRDEESSKTVDREVYMALLKIKLTQKDLGTVYMDRVLRAVGEAALLKGQKGHLEVAYVETLMGFFEGFARSLIKKQKNWLDLVVPSDKVASLEQDLKRVSEVMPLCR